MDSLGEDLVLLSIRSENGTIGTGNWIAYGLMGAELARLAARGQVDITGGRLVVRSPVPTGDSELDAALESLIRARRPPRPKFWVGRPRPGILGAYLARLAEAGVVRAEPRRSLGIIPRFPRTRWFITEPLRAASARARLDSIAHSAGETDSEQAMFAGLAHAVGLDQMLYPGRANWQLRKRLQQLGQRQWIVAAVSAAVASAKKAPLVPYV